MNKNKVSVAPSLSGGRSIEPTSHSVLDCKQNVVLFFKNSVIKWISDPTL